MVSNLVSLYGDVKGANTFRRLHRIIDRAKETLRDKEFHPHTGEVSQKNIALITYANAFQSEEDTPLATLDRFLTDQVGDAINTVHILPFHPFTSDRGFSVVDYDQVEDSFGSWEDIEAIAKKKRLMADLVVGHVSAKNKWVQDAVYEDFVIEVDSAEITEEQRAAVVRPRTTPFHTEIVTDDGRSRTLWTTFSVDGTTDQVDLNYKNPDVLLAMIEANLLHMQKGASIVRMDAIAYLWKELGTGCINRPEVHKIVQLFRDVREEVSPSSTIITETNVPHDENISYFGTDGQKEADWVYNFSLPPLVLHAFYSGDTSYLKSWAATLQTPTEQNAFFNFLGSHDGIGLRGAKGILPDEEIDKLSEKVLFHGGKVSSRSLSDGSESVYELNTTWWSALNNGEESENYELQKFITSHAISFALRGVPAVYYHSLLGSENDIATWEQTGTNSIVNEKKLNYAEVAEKLGNPESKEYKVFHGLKKLMKERAAHPAFSPIAPQEIITGLDKRIFGIRRSSDEGDVVALHNVSGETVEVMCDNSLYFIEPYGFTWEPVEKGASDRVAQAA